ncbi:hypothetical protein DMUE_5904 [Dictyocoela muelleri]|nr:hypothetical protein DMUE_5904 [Dictyocoela muelleri]
MLSENSTTSWFDTEILNEYLEYIKNEVVHKSLSLIVMAKIFAIRRFFKNFQQENGTNFLKTAGSESQSFIKKFINDLLVEKTSEVFFKTQKIENSFNPSNPKISKKLGNNKHLAYNPYISTFDYEIINGPVKIKLFSVYLFYDFLENEIINFDISKRMDSHRLLLIFSVMISYIISFIDENWNHILEIERRRLPRDGH